MAGFMNPYNQETNEGVILMAVAENKLTWDLLQSNIQKSLSKPLPQWTSGYGPMHGQVILREVLSKFINKYIINLNSDDHTNNDDTAAEEEKEEEGKNDYKINPDELSCATGCSSIISNMFYCLFEPQDTILIPSPYYSAFDSDLRAYADLNRHCVPLNLNNNFELSVEILEEEYEKVFIQTGKTPKALLITNPHNPTGTIMSSEKYYEIIKWCESKNNFHLISDEIYALSFYGDLLKNNHNKKNNESSNIKNDFISLGKLCKGQLGSHKHIIWGMSKDFGMSGLRFGMLWTQNQTLFEAMANVAPFNSIPGPIQSMLCDMLGDDEFVHEYLITNSKNLAKSCQVLIDFCDELNIPYVTPSSGMFIWVNMSSLLQGIALKHDLKFNPNEIDMNEYLKSKEAFILEDLLYKDMWLEAKVVGTPGSSQHMSHAGWFRFCYAAIPIEVLEIGVQNLSQLFRTIISN
jgi:aspartate/methionine/tyrosine aminotransferase